MLNTNYIVVFDFETTGLSSVKDDAIQIASVTIDPRTLETVPGSEFNSLMRPVTVMTGKPEEVEANWANASGALRVNGKKREELEQAPLPQHVWKAFAAHIAKYNTKGWNGKPIPAGHNIQGFDLLFVDELCRRYGPIDKEGKQGLFNTRTILDTLNFCFIWFESLNEPENFKMDTLRSYLGMSFDGAHDAGADVAQTSYLLTRFLKLHRRFTRKVSFKGAFAKENV